MRKARDVPDFVFRGPDLVRARARITRCGTWTSRDMVFGGIEGHPCDAVRVKQVPRGGTLLDQLQPVAVGGSVDREGPVIAQRPDQFSGIPIAYARGFSGAVGRQCHVPIRLGSATADLRSVLRPPATETTDPLTGSTGGEFVPVVRQPSLKATWAW